MMLNPEGLRRRTARLSNDELRDIVTVSRRSYRQIAIALAEDELRRRGLSPAPPVAAVSQRTPGGRRRRVATAPPPAQGGGDGLTLFCEIVCAVVGSIVLAVLFVSARETQKAILRWAGTSLALPYTVWRGARYVDRRWPQGGVQQGQAIN